MEDQMFFEMWTGSSSFLHSVSDVNGVQLNVIDGLRHSFPLVYCGFGFFSVKMATVPNRDRDR